MTILTSSTYEVAYLAERDWRLRHLILAVGDLEYTVSGTAYSHLAHSVIEQMLAINVGRAIENRLAEECGGRICQEAILSLDVERIRSAGISSRKAETLIALAKSFSDEDLEELALIDDDEVRRRLTSVHGIGKWTADMFLIFYLERPDVLPVEDGAIRQVFKWLYGAQITDASVRDVVCTLWQPYSSIAARFMYRALNLGLLKNGDSKAVLKY